MSGTLRGALGTGIKEIKECGPHAEEERDVNK